MNEGHVGGSLVSDDSSHRYLKLLLMPLFGSRLYNIDKKPTTNSQNKKKVKK